jgi:hypothetical protein
MPTTVQHPQGRQQHRMDANNSRVFAEIGGKVVRATKIREERHKKNIGIPSEVPTSSLKLSSFKNTQKNTKSKIFIKISSGACK